jgi:hypothetical protein
MRPPRRPSCCARISTIRDLLAFRDSHLGSASCEMCKMPWKDPARPWRASAAGAWVNESFGEVVELMRLALGFINSHLVQEARRSIAPWRGQRNLVQEQGWGSPNSTTCQLVTLHSGGNIPARRTCHRLGAHHRISRIKHGSVGPYDTICSASIRLEVESTRPASAGCLPSAIFSSVG